MRSFFERRTALLLPLALTFLVSTVMASTVLQMNLGQMCDRADRIFRGTVLDSIEGVIEIGGGELPTITYVIRVDEAFKGSFPKIKGEPLVEIRTLGKIPPVRVGDAERVSVLPEVPEFAIGRSYLLFATAPSSTGLSTTVGLGQGAFRIKGAAEKEVAINERNNVGLFDGMGGLRSRFAGGPLPYARLADAIRADLQGVQ